MQGSGVFILKWVNRVMSGIVWKYFIGSSLNRFLIILMMYTFRFMRKNEKKNLFPHLYVFSGKAQKKLWDSWTIFNVLPCLRYSLTYGGREAQCTCMSQEQYARLRANQDPRYRKFNHLIASKPLKSKLLNYGKLTQPRNGGLFICWLSNF